MAMRMRKDCLSEKCGATKSNFMSDISESGYIRYISGYIGIDAHRQKFWAKKSNVKFFTVDPYLVGTGVSRTKLIRFQKIIFLKFENLTILYRQKHMSNNTPTQGNFLIFLKF